MKITIFNNTYFRTTLIILLFISAGSVRLWKTFSLKTLTHDGSIALAAAAGQHNAFGFEFSSKGEILNRWTQARKWKRFLTIEHPFCFREIQSGLKNHDIHPPLYFWLLHVWMLICGTHAWTGPLLNIILASLSAIVLFYIFRIFTKENLSALSVSLIWFACPPAMASSMMARQYDLLTLLGLILIWMVIRISDAEKTSRYYDWGLIALISALGLLTHFHFLLLISGCGLFVSCKIPAIGWKKALTCFGAMAIGCLLFYIIYGNPGKTFAQAKLQSQAYDSEQFSNRIEFVWHSLSFFWGSSRIAEITTKIFLSGTIALLLLHILNVFKIWTPRIIRSHYVFFPVLYFFLWTTGITVGLYLSFVSPNHAISSRYLCLTWPFFAGLFVSIIRFLPRYSNFIAYSFGAFLIVTSAISNIDHDRVYTPDSDPIPTFKRVDAVIIDMPNRGYLFPAIFQLNDDQLVYVGRQKEILENKEEFMQKQHHTIAYYNMNIYGNTPQMGAQVVELLKKDYLLNLKGTVWDTGNLIFGSRARK